MLPNEDIVRWVKLKSSAMAEALAIFQLKRPHITATTCSSREVLNLSP